MGAEESGSVLEIVQVGDPVLRGRAATITREQIKTPEIQDLIDNMRETMRDAPGVGLAAPQVGVGLRIAVIEDRAEYHEKSTPWSLALRRRVPVPFHVLINPVLSVGSIAGAPRHPTFWEGCLSFPGFMALRSRHYTVRVTALDHTGEEVIISADGWYARILQHEVDHLDGEIFLDQATHESLTTLEHYERYWKDVPIDELVKELASRHGRGLQGWATT